MQKIALVTGTSTGLGASFSVELAKRGYKVYATMRHLGKRSFLEEKAKQADVDLFIEALDVTVPESIDRLVQKILAKEGRIDLLINNAGAGFLKPSEFASEEEVKAQFDLNFNGVMRCTNAVLPTMRAQHSGQIINISSVGGLVGQPFNEIYCATKFAVEGYTEGLASYLTPNFGIHFSLVEPGGIATEFANSVLKGVQAYGGVTDDDYKPIIEQYITNAQGRSEEVGSVYQTADDCAKVSLDQILVDNPPLRMRPSEWAEKFSALKTAADPDGLKLWEQTVSLTAAD